MLRNAILVCIPMLFCGSVRSQTISYLTPDAAAPGMSVVVEFIGPNLVNNFGEDGMNKATVQFIDAADSDRIMLGPSVTSWNGRVVSVMFLLTDSAKAGPVPLRLSISNQLSTVDTFFIMNPQHVGALTAAGTLGSGGRFGVRSKRNVLVVDSLIIGPGPTTISSNDPDPSTAGNQAFLPFTILSRGSVRIMGSLSVSATGKDAIAGGGGGGGAAYTPGGNGFSGGGGTQHFGGVGSGSDPMSVYQGGASLNGISGALGDYQDQGGGGGTGFPFGSSGLNGTWFQQGGVSKAGGFGGASAGGEHSNLDTSYGGGGGGFSTDGKTGSLNGDNRGHGYGNPMVIPFCGGSGGAAANTYGQGTPGSGGGGGGAINIITYDELSVDAPIEANGADGESSFSGYAGGGGAGSGGAIELSSQDLILLNNSLSAIGGNGGSAVYAVNGGGMRGGDGGAGAVRINGELLNSGVRVVDGTTYIGPTVKKCIVANFETSILEGTGAPKDTIYIYYRTARTAWNYSRPLKTTVHPDSTWEYPFGISRNVPTYVVAIQKDQLILDSMHYQPEWVMSHTSGAILCTESSSVNELQPEKRFALNVSVISDENSPAITRLRISGGAGEVKIEIFDLLGRKLYENELRAGNLLNVDIPKGILRSGTYFYRVESNAQVSSGKLKIVE